MKKIRLIVLVLLVTLGLMISGMLDFAQARTTTRPIQDFLDAQGTFCFGTPPDCFLFVPPDPNFLGWNSDTDKSPILFAGVDYAGLANAYPSGQGPEFSGTVTERPLKNGTVEVTVILHTKNANVWVIELDLSGDLLDQIANKPTLFGHRPADVLLGAGQALGDSLLHVVFINIAAGAPLPDLIEMNAGLLDVRFLSFQVQAQGPLTAQFGVPEGTPGMCKISQTGLFMTHGKGVALVDSFPAEQIKLQVIGK